ncbi:hypothetical protein [Flavobacterium foetidum]|uniref:hypothetical protein n=1 Tax=Flavobacterium foetidum TaxID=2026681 RepID=UPI00107508F4|nr:hypothetical protein [Flavobacterium foetidum]KAF2511932.1 hypothetical protein E0W73_16540 [Flavobacterium foetidum]
MIIALHGGLPLEMLYGLGGGFFVAVLYFIFAHYKMGRTEYYNEEFVYFPTIKKLGLYLVFLFVNSIIGYVVFLISAFIIMWLTQI